MSVSRRASFAAGIAAVRRDRRKRLEQQRQQGGNNYPLPEDSPVVAARHADANSTIVVYAGAVPQQCRQIPSSSSPPADVILTPPVGQGGTLDAPIGFGGGGGGGAGQDGGRAAAVAKGSASPGGGGSGEGGMAAASAISGALDVSKAASAFAAVAKAASVASRKPRIQYEVRPFTRESLEKINIRTSNLVRDYGFLPKRSPNLADGAQLPAKYEPFPTELLGKPVEELDQYVYEKVREAEEEEAPRASVYFGATRTTRPNARGHFRRPIWKRRRRWNSSPPRRGCYTCPSPRQGE
jgi:hypothetical protein